MQFQRIFSCCYFGKLHLLGDNELIVVLIITYFFLSSPTHKTTNPPTRTSLSLASLPYHPNTVVTPNGRHDGGISHRQFNCLFNRAVKDTLNENIQALRYWPFARKIHCLRVDSPHKRRVMRKCFIDMTPSCPLFVSHTNMFDNIKCIDVYRMNICACLGYRQTSNICHTLWCSWSTACRRCSNSTLHLASMDWTKTTARRNQKHLSFGIWCDLYKMFDNSVVVVDQQHYVHVDRKQHLDMSHWFGFNYQY